MKKRLFTVLLAVCLVLALGTVSALADDDTPVVQIGNETYTSLEEVMYSYAFGANDKLVLLADCSTSWLKIPNNSVIDLNGHDLTYTGTTTVTFSGAIGSGKEASIIDSSVSGSEIGGSLIIDGERPDGVASVFEIINTTLNVRNIGVQSTGCVFFPKGSDAELNITNCDITTSGVFCVSTNAGSQANYGVTINILNSSLTANSNNKDDCGIMMNVSGTLNIENSTITGNRQGVIARAGDVNIVNSEITVTGAWAEQSGNDADKYYDSDWQISNETPSAAIVIGNRNGTYFADADVNINDSKIVSKNDDLSAMHVDATTTAQGESEVKYASYVSITGSDTVVTGDITSNAQDSADKSIEIAVTGGTYDSNVSAYIQDGAALKQDGNGTIVVDESAKTVANVDGVGYTELAKAIAAADDGDTVTLEENVNIDSTIVIDKGIEFDLGGNTITVVSSDSWASTGVRNALSFTSGNSVIKNGRILDVRSMYNTTGNWGIAAISGSASLTTESIEMQTYQPSSEAYYNYILRAAATNAGEGTLTLNAGTVLSELPKTSPEVETYGAVAVSVLGKYNNSTVTNIDDGYVGEKLVINDGVIIDTTGFAVTGNGAAHGTTIEINGGVLSSGSLAIYHPQVGNLTVNGGTLTGEFTGIEVRAGNVVINDGTITSTSDTFNCEPNGNGTTTTGAALAIAQHTTKQDISVEINGGTFNGIRAVNEANPQKNDQTPNVDISIKDGEYIGEISAVDVDNFISGGSFSDPVSPEYLDDSLNAELYSRSNSDTPYSYYSTVEKAMNAAQPGDIVTDLSNVTSSDTRYNVTFNYGNNDSETVSVSEGATITFNAPTRSGYEFRGWRDNSGELHKAGETVTVDSDMTFTAVWSAINIPDTYDIEIADAANGSVDTSLSNASAGSTITITATPDSGYSVASVTVTGPDSRVDVVRVNATTYTFKMPAGDVTVRVTFTDSDALPFTDVSAGQWFYDAVAYVYTNGMMEGDSATTFNPDGTMTRAMFWAVLGRIDGATITGTNWADQARDWAMAEGVSDGTDPNGLVTREQMVTMLWRYAGEPESSASLSAYTDADSVSDWAETAMRWAIDEGIITGMTDTTLVPQGTATRAQCAAIFMRFDQM